MSAAALLGCVGCSGLTPPTAPERPAARVEHGIASIPAGISIYGVGGIERTDGTTGCTGSASHQFDFWLGSWSVTSRVGAFAAVNPVTAELDGCVLQEHWTPVTGLPGRSLSSYDPLTDRWRQTWVTAAGRPLRLDGQLRPDGVMEMSGVRIHWFFGYHYLDDYTWTRVDADHVIQQPTFDLPELNIHSQGLLTYSRTDPLPSVTALRGDRCLPGGDTEETRNLDFVQGSWLVRSGTGALLGHSRIAVDQSLSDCLIEEQFAGSKRYRALGWLYFDPIVNRYFRTYVDNAGNRLELAGGYAAGRLTLSGTQSLPGSPTTTIRMTWEPAPGGLQQTWERSDDGGSTWAPIDLLRFTPDDGE